MNQNLNNLREFYNNNLNNPFNDAETKDILLDIKNIIKNEEVLIYDNKEIPKYTLYLFNTISQYKIAYEQSRIKELQSRKNTFESLGKGTLRRQKRFDRNKETIDNLKVSKDLKIVPYIENFVLKYMISDTKLGNLLLSLLFIYKNTINNFFSYFFISNNKTSNILNKMNESLTYFEYTYLAPSKIVNSTTILIHIFLKEHSLLNETDNLKFIKNIINTYFFDDAPILRKDFLEKKVYCAGIYNKLPIFQWYSSTKHTEYYTIEDIEKYKSMYLEIAKDLGALSNIINYTFIKGLSKENKKIILNNDIPIKYLIDNMPNTYLKMQSNLVKTLYKKQTKTIKYYLILPIRYLATKFVALVIKFTLK